MPLVNQIYIQKNIIYRNSEMILNKKSLFEFQKGSQFCMKERINLYLKVLIITLRIQCITKLKLPLIPLHHTIP